MFGFSLAARRITLAIGAAAIALGAITATALPARANGDDVAKVIAGVTALAIIGSAISNSTAPMPRRPCRAPGLLTATPAGTMTAAAAGTIRNRSRITAGPRPRAVPRPAPSGSTGGAMCRTAATAAGAGPARRPTAIPTAEAAPARALCPGRFACITGA